MDSQKRHRFTKDFVYPPYSFKGGVAGRLVRMEREGPRVRLTLESGECVKADWDLDLEDGYKLSEVLTEGDLIWCDEASGRVRILAPALCNPPEFNLQFSLAEARRWQRYMGCLRSFFEERDFVEVRTPTLVASPGLEPHLDPFKTAFEWGANSREFYLPTSPEFNLKKLLSAGWPKIFEFKECFRNGELGAHHQPEFLMLEWYRAYADMDPMMADVRDLLLKLQTEFSGPEKALPVEVTSMAELFKKYLNFELAPSTTADQLKDLARRVDVRFENDENFDDVFARVFLEKIESQLGLVSPLIVCDYPPSQAALARINDRGWAARFEVYWKGFELANAFQELNDPREQRIRFDRFHEEKRALGKLAVREDPEFLGALEWGMPPSVGIALGVERLFLALMGSNNLAGSRPFPLRERHGSQS